MASDTNGEDGLGHVTAQLSALRRDLDARKSAHLLTVQQQLQAVSQGDYDVALRRAHPDIELEIFAPPIFPFIRRARGVAELRRALEHNFNAIVDQQPMLSNVLAEGDLVVFFGTERGRIRETNEPYHIEFVHRFTFADSALKSIRILAAHAQSDPPALP